MLVDVLNLDLQNGNFNKIDSSNWVYKLFDNFYIDLKPNYYLNFRCNTILVGFWFEIFLQ